MGNRQGKDYQKCDEARGKEEEQKNVEKCNLKKNTSVELKSE